MTAVLWVAFGVTIGAAVLHTALGLPRPRDRTHLSFACIMLMLAAYVFFETAVYRLTSSEAAVEAIRDQMIAAHGLLAFALVFVPAYTHVRIPRWLIIVFAVGLAVLFVANIVAPYGIWFAAEPHPIATTFGGVTYLTFVAPAPSTLQYVHSVYLVAVFALMIACALAQVRRGDRRRGSMLALALAVVIVANVADIVRDSVGGTWPYVSEYGLLMWGLIMSVQLAIDYRLSQQRLRAALVTSKLHAAELARIAEAALHVRDKLNTPLQTLELTLSVRTPRTSDDQQTLGELREAVTEISELSRAVERTTAHPSALTALERAS